MKTTKSHMEFNGCRIGPGEPCYVIAEVGVNHNGDLILAKRLVDAAIEAGANAVKFQKRLLAETYQHALLDEPRHGEQGLQYLVPLLAEFELTDEAFRGLFGYCREKGIVALCTPWDQASVDFLETLNVPAYKIGSPDMTNFPLIEHVLKTGKPLLMSTGMSTEEEIRRTLSFLRLHDTPCALLHCNSTYPAPPEEINLAFMETLREWTGWPVGYSGHDTGIAISLAAVGMGANLLERHLTLDRRMRGPDHSASLEPRKFAELVAAVREAETAIGVPHRWVTRGELLNRRILGKSLAAKEPVPAGTVLTRAMITSKSPGLGLSPQFVDELVGRRITRDLAPDDFFTEDDLGDAEDQDQAKPVDVRTRWGVIARFTDVERLVRRFQPAGMSLLEFHISDRDLDAGLDAFRPAEYACDLVVHAPEYFGDQLIDLCSPDAELRCVSIRRIQETVDLVRRLEPSFQNSFSNGPRIVFHVGGMSSDGKAYDVGGACDRLLNSLRRLSTTGVDLLLENLPPYPWYFGGRWFGHVMTDAENVRRLCAESGLGLCLDTSHAALECHRSRASLMEFARCCLPFIRHLHVSDAAGTSGEGLQIGEGQINFVALMPLLVESRPSMVPEIWMGHHRNGRGFRLALERLSDALWASRVLGVAKGVYRGPVGLNQLLTRSTGTVLTALQTIDVNKLGITFVVDELNTVLGVVTDGDIRHALAQGVSLDGAITAVMTRDFVFGTEGMTREELRTMLPGRSRVMPVLDADRRLVGYASDHWPA